MSDYLKSLTSGIARFAFAWFLPTSVAVGLFWIVCVPPLVADRLLNSVTGVSQDGAKRDLLAALGVASFIIIALSVLLAYTSQFIYRVLEGYHFPRAVDRYLTQRQLRRKMRLIEMKSRLDTLPNGTTAKEYGLAVEKLELYPVGDSVLPTRLGNALRSMELYGDDRFSFDSQQFWYELVGTAEEAVRRESEEARSQVDVFVAAVAVSFLLVLVSFSVGVATGDGGPILLAIASALLAPLAYRQALRNMKEWKNSVRALVNLGRPRVAAGMGLVLPRKLEDERRMWQSVSGVLHYRTDGWRDWYDAFRMTMPPGFQDGRWVEPSSEQTQ